MGCKICKPKTLECLTCHKNINPKEPFCFEKEACSTPYAMVRDGKIIGYDTGMTPEERRARNIALANTEVPQNPKIEEAFEDIWSGTEDIDRRGLSQQLIDCIKALSHDFFETGVLWAREDIYEAALVLVDSVEKYVRQECSRSTLLSMKDKLKELLEK